MIQYELLCLCRRTCKRFGVYLLDHILKYEIENRISHNLGVHPKQMPVKNVHKEAERAQRQPGLIGFVKISVALPFFWN
jgi:hypothetical protein